MTPSSNPAGLFSALRERFTVLWLAPLLAVVALGSWALASPLGSSPDDDFHLASIWCSGTTSASQCAEGEDGERAVPVALLSAPCFAYDENASAACQASSVTDSVTTDETDRGNFQQSYPPVFYAVMGLFAGPDFEASAITMRFVTITLFVVLLTALFVLLPAALRPPLIWTWLITTVPLGLFLLASNNPSSWALIGVGTAWIALLGYLGTTGQRRIALGGLFLVAALMAAGSRGDSAIYLVLTVGLVLLLTAHRERGYLLSLLLPAAASLGAVLLYFSSQQAGVASSGLGEANGEAPGGLSGFSLLAFNLLNVPELWTGIFTDDVWGLGWLDTSMPAVVTAGALVVFAGVVFSGLGDLSWRKALGIMGLLATLWLLPTYVLVRGTNAVGQNVQPRYLLPLILVMAGLAMFAAGGKAVSFNRFQIVAVVTALSIANSVALHMNIRRYVTGVDSPGWNLDEGVEWWWAAGPSPMGVWVLGSLALGALFAILVRSIASPRVVP